MAIDEFVFDSSYNRGYDMGIDPFDSFFKNMRWKPTNKMEGNDRLLDEEEKHDH